MPICEKKFCTGCSACADICPCNCIVMKNDDYGVEYPEIDSSKCKNCGLCKKVCPIINPIEKKQPFDCYAAYETDENIRKNSASGGIGAALYKSFLESFDGRVYGVKADSEAVRFIGTSDVTYIENFKGSQYTQAYTDNIYCQVYTDLSAGKKVLFIGCPCQISGCINYIRSRVLSTENLYTVDLLCHGVTPQKYLKEELNYISEKKKWKIVSKVTFRSYKKDYNYNFSFSYEDRKNKKQEYRKYVTESPYFSGFMFNTALRESCYNCSLSTLGRTADLTIGDFIGLAESKSSVPYDGLMYNTSVVLVNTDKGKELVSVLPESVVRFKRPIEEAYEGSSSMHGPGKPSQYREKFLQLYPQYGFPKAIRKALAKELFIAPIKKVVKKVICYEYWKRFRKKK